MSPRPAWCAAGERWRASTLVRRVQLPHIHGALRRPCRELTLQRRCAAGRPSGASQGTDTRGRRPWRRLCHEREPAIHI